MNETKTISVKGLTHPQKEALLFPNLESLKPGQTLKVVFDFYPEPLIYMLKARGEHQASFEKQGPVEWILNITRNVPAGKTVELDLRAIVPFERHDLIFQKWEALAPGETLKIINDHDPKPLHYQFDAEYKDQFEWEYLQKGPKDWMVTIKRTKAPQAASV